MQFENTFVLAGAPAEVIAMFEDVPLLAGFLPGTSVGERKDDGSYPGQLTVAFGPKRLTFKGSLTNVVQREQLAGELAGHASADVRGAKMMVNMRYQLSPAAGGTQVNLVSDAELTGILAEFARTGGVVVTQALLEEFARNFSAHIRENRAAQPAGAPGNARQQPQALSAFALLWRILKNAFSRLARPRT